MVRMRFAAALAAFACAVSAARGGTLSTRFSTVQCDDVPFNATVAPRLPDGSGYVLKNDSDRPIRVAVRSLRPSFCEPVPGQRPFRPLPTNCVVRIEPAVIDLEPHSEGEAFVAIDLPDDPALEGGRFETWIRSEAILGQAGVALVSRVRLTVGKRNDGGPAPRPAAKGEAAQDPPPSERGEAQSAAGSAPSAAEPAAPANAGEKEVAE